MGAFHTICRWWIHLSALSVRIFAGNPIGGTEIETVQVKLGNRRALGAAWVCQCDPRSILSGSGARSWQLKVRRFCRIDWTLSETIRRIGDTQQSGNNRYNPDKNAPVTS